MDVMDDDDDDDIEPDDPDQPQTEDLDWDLTDQHSETEPCPWCKRPVYEQAEMCPHCGNYLSHEDAPASRRPMWIILAVVGCLLVILLIWMLSPPQPQ